MRGIFLFILALFFSNNIDFRVSDFKVINVRLFFFT